jgi:hypothetical protein
MFTLGLAKDDTDIQLERYRVSWPSMLAMPVFLLSGPISSALEHHALPGSGKLEAYLVLSTYIPVLFGRPYPQGHGPS